MSPDELVALELPRPRQEDGALVAHVTVVDGYGNVQLDAAPGDLGGQLGRAVEVGDGRPARYLRTFADAEAGELLLYEDPAGVLAPAVQGGGAGGGAGGPGP